MHQKKLETELQQIEEKHRAKKCKFAENSEQFYEELARLCEERPQISESQFMTMVLKAKEELREKQKQQQQLQQIAASEGVVQQTDQQPVAVVQTAEQPQMIDKKPDDRSSTELAQQQSQQLCVLDTKPSVVDNQIKEDSNEYESTVPEMEQDKSLNEVDSEDGGSDDTQPADDDFTSAFTSAGAEDSTELCAENCEKDDIISKNVPVEEEVSLADKVIIPSSEDVTMHQNTFAEQDSSFVTPPTTLSPSVETSASLYVSDRDERPWPEVVMAGDNVHFQEPVNGVTDVEVPQPTEEITPKQQPSPTSDPRNSANLPLSIEVDPSGRDASLMSDMTDESTDDTRGESACEMSMGDDQS